MSREPNHRLAGVMAEAGASNKGLAKRVREVAERHGEHLGTTHVAVQRWLDGRGIQRQTAVYVAEALSHKLRRRVTPGDLGFPGTSPAPAVRMGYAGPLTETLHALEGLTHRRPEDGRPGEPQPADAEVHSAALTWLVSRPDGVPTDGSDNRRVSMREVAAIRTAAGFFMQLDFQFGGGHAHKAFRHYFREDVLPLLGANYSAKVGEALFKAAAEMSQLLAWTAYDSGNHALSDRYLLSTLRLTQVVGDRMMGARVLANMSHQANYLGQAGRALMLARAAVEGGKAATPRARALFSAHEARALSTAQDRKGAARAMNEAEKFFERADGADDPEWLSYMDEAELMGEFCHCFRDLGQRSEALRFARRAVELTDPKYARTLGLCRLVRAQSQLMSGDLEAAVTTAALAVEAGDALQSARFQRYVSDFQRAVSAGHAAQPVVRQFSGQVRDALNRLDDE
ncbi:sporulation protein [Streptomyces nigrescens]|uniref:sporulation protein n=1 Tax=Streptomyces nigrescens TaxID=1920 RepID=UPI003495D071